MFSSFPAVLFAASTLLSAGQRANGGIEGRIVVRQLPAVIANRYAGADGAGTRDVAPLPAMVYIEGAVPGTSMFGVRGPEMAQQDTSFQPPILVIPVGTTVRFPNQDKFFHNVFSYSKTKRFDLGRYPKGEAKTVTFDKPGGVSVFCEIHKWMRGAILVVENPFYATVAKDGTFSIPNVPPGRYKVTVWHPERGKKSFDVVVPATGNARIDATI